MFLKLYIHAVHMSYHKFFQICIDYILLHTHVYLHHVYTYVYCLHTQCFRYICTNYMIYIVAYTCLSLAHIMFIHMSIVCIHMSIFYLYAIHYVLDMQHIRYVLNMCTLYIVAYTIVSSIGIHHVYICICHTFIHYVLDMYNLYIVA